MKINYSFIICEDGSTDQTLLILKNLKNKLKLNIFSKKKTRILKCNYKWNENGKIEIFDDNGF